MLRGTIRSDSTGGPRMGMSAISDRWPGRQSRAPLLRTGAIVKRLRILAVSSGGGHWVQLLRLQPAFDGHRVTYVTVHPAYREDVPGERFRAINDGTRWSKAKLALMAIRLLWIVLVERPNVVISTGAAPGFFALRLGKLMGARTIWVDSIANVEQLSMSGQLVRPHADLWLTQWPHLAGPAGPHYLGGIL